MSTLSLPSPPPEALERLLPPEVDLADPPRHEASRPIWLGVVWSRLGRADIAWQFWDRVGADDVQAWLAAERGRVLRELGLHAEAERLEWPALARADDPTDRAMLQISLTADAVGRGDVDTAQRRLDNATQAVADLPATNRSARQRLRLSWVRAEVAWIAGEDPPTDGLPHRTADGTIALPADLTAGTDFHHAKALLFGGLVSHDSGMLDEALATSPPVLTWAIHLARADMGAPDGVERARHAWRDIHPPPRHAAAVAASPTAQRLSP